MAGKLVNKSNRDVIWNTIGTSLFSFNSLFLMIIVTRLNGIQAAGVFSFSFASASIVNIIALYFGRTYHVTDKSEGIDDSVFVVTRYITALFAFLIALSFSILNQYELDKFLVFCLLAFLKCIEAISDLYYGILQKKHCLYIVGKSMSYRSIVSLCFFLFVNLLTNNLLLSCLTLVLIASLYLYYYDINNSNKVQFLVYKIQFKLVKKLLVNSSYTFIFTLIILVVVNVPRYAIDYLLNDEAQAIYSIISMPATFMMLFGQFILQPALVSLSTYYHNNDYHSFNKQTVKIVIILFLFLLPILPFSYFLGIPLLQIIYNYDLAGYESLLVLVLFGSICYAASSVLLNALVTLRCTKPQVVLQFFLLTVSVIISIVLIRQFGIKGSLLSYFVIFLLQFIFYILLYVHIIKKRFSEGIMQVISN